MAIKNFCFLKKNQNFFYYQIQPITAKAAILYEEGQPMVVESVVIEPPGPGEVRVKIVSAGVCAGDAHFVWGEAKMTEWPGHSTPEVLGHEGAGIVESMGVENDNEDDQLKVGDHVLTTCISLCRKCPVCQSGRCNICPNENLFVLAGKPNKKLQKTENDVPLKSFMGLGVFSEYVLLKRSQVVKVKTETKKFTNFNPLKSPSN